MTEITNTDPGDDASDEVCILDPGGEGRANVPVTDADHSPADDPVAADRVMAPVADALFAAAGLVPGDAVIDVGCGCGATTLRAADEVAPDGSVYGIDVTEPMLAIAQRRLDSSGLTNVTLVQGDAQAHAFPSPFDVAISRFGTMFFYNPVAAFANIGRGLRPGGRVCFATWQPLEANDWLAVPGAALLRWITIPDVSEGVPGMFAQSDADTITAVLREAGYRDIEVNPIRVMLPLGPNPDEAVERLVDTGVGRAVLGAVAERDRPAALTAVRAALGGHADAQGVRLGAAIWIITGLHL
jgi:SAM-dependent methyltransferase